MPGIYLFLIPDIYKFFMTVGTLDNTTLAEIL